MSDVSGKPKYKVGDIVVDKHSRILQLLRLEAVGLYSGRVSDLWHAFDCDTGLVIEIWLDRKH